MDLTITNARLKMQPGLRRHDIESIMSTSKFQKGAKIIELTKQKIHVHGFNRFEPSHSVWKPDRIMCSQEYCLAEIRNLDPMSSEMTQHLRITVLSTAAKHWLIRS